MSLTVYLGPMYAGKTTALLRDYSRLLKTAKTGERVALVKWQGDVRDEGNTVCAHSHPDLMQHADYHLQTLNEMGTLTMLNGLTLRGKIRHVLVDEAQFFPDLASAVERFVSDEGKHVVLSMLSGTFERKPWQDIGEIVAMADRIVHMTAICFDCNEDGAAFSFKVSGDPKVVVEIGGKSKYIAVCRSCHHKRDTQK